MVVDTPHLFLKHHRVMDFCFKDRVIRLIGVGYFKFMCVLCRWQSSWATLVLFDGAVRDWLKARGTMAVSFRYLRFFFEISF